LISAPELLQHEMKGRSAMHEAVNTQTAAVAVVPLIGEHDLSGYELLKAVLA
jgi:hypothetical protein